jgi:ParB/RepB/Spo0J family partition protein
MSVVKVVEICLSAILLGANLRLKIDANRVEEIVASAQVHGIIVPIEVMQNADGSYTLIDGWHRLTAAGRLGMEKIPSIVRCAEFTNTNLKEHQFVLNAIRGNLNPVERSQCVHELRATGLKDGEIAKRLGLRADDISRISPIYGLSDEIKTLITDGKVSESAGYYLSHVDDLEERNKLAQRLAQRQLTRDQLASFVRNRKSPKANGKPGKAKCSTIQLKGGHTFNLADSNQTLDSLIGMLSPLLGQARKAQKRGTTLANFVALVNAEVAAGGA